VTPEQIARIRTSFAGVAPIAEDAAALFYARLFELDPELRPLFRGDLKAQGRALMGMIKVVVEGLDRLDQLVPAVQALGRRHAGYGVRDEHYATVGAALLWTLEQGLGDAFTPETRAAWAIAYGVLATTMQQAASGAASGAAGGAAGGAAHTPARQGAPVGTAA
jgi:nitric oxide dioxygenase